MNCDAVLERLVLWVGRDLPADEQAAVEAHLTDCAECSAEAAAWRADHERIVEFERMNAGPEPEPTHLERMIEAAEEAARADSPAAARGLGFWRWVGPIAALLAVFLFWRLVPLPSPRTGTPSGVAEGMTTWEQLQAEFEGCLQPPVPPRAWRADTGPGLITVLAREGQGYLLADCIEVSDLERVSRYPWLEQRLEKYRRQAGGGIYLAVCSAEGMDRGQRRALRTRVLDRFGEAGGAS